MSFEKSVLRFAHANGHTDCCYTEDGEKIITSGSDGDIRIWQGIHDDDPISQCVGEFVQSICQYDQRILAATDLNTVQAYTFPDGDRDGTEFRFTAPVTCMAVDETYISAGSEDTMIKIVLRNKSEEPFELIGHEGPILSLDLNPAGLLASCSGDGTIRIWNLKEKSQIKIIDGFDKVKSFSVVKYFISATFEPTKSKTMAYIKHKEIFIIDTGNFVVLSTLKNDKCSSAYTVCRFSYCGRYLAAGTDAGDVIIWDVRSGQVIKVDSKGNDAQCVTAICWNPSNNKELAYTDNTGQLGTVKPEIDTLPDDENEIGGDAYIEDRADEDFGGLELIDGEAGDDDDDADNENCVSLERLKNETMGHNLDDDIDSILEMKTNCSESIADGIGGGGSGGRDVAGGDIAGYDGIPNGMMIIKPKPLQPPFQPSSTPKSLEHRYLVWNDVGIVRAHATDSEDSIEVEFHDASVHHGIHMSNYLHHTMASLSKTVLALSGETPSKLVCIALAAGSREWSISLPNCEEVLALTATEKLVAIATDLRYLRIFSALGTQREVICLPGPVLSITGHGDQIFVTYHKNHGFPAGGDDSHQQQGNIGGMLVQAIGLTLRSRDISVPLTPGNGIKLNWIGFTDKGSPVCADSMGMIRLFNSKANYWMPICDTSLHIKNASDTFFILSVSEHSQIVRAILCRGASYPLTAPKPMVTEVPMQLPLCDLEAEKTLLEEQLLRYANLNANNSQRLMIELAIKLFALACRSEMEARAKELIEMIASPNLLPLAIKYATKQGRLHLADRLNELLPKFEEQEREKDRLLNNVEMEAINLLQNSPMSATLLLAQKDKSSSSTSSAITPKPLSVSQQKRNPFKRSGLSSGTAKQITNPLSHLTDKAIGFNDSQNSMFPSSSSVSGVTPLNNDDDDDEKINYESNENNENKASNENKPTTASTVPPQSSAAAAATATPLTFIQWFNQNKEELQQEFPEAIAAELTKLAMRKYKSLSAASKEQKSSTSTTITTTTTAATMFSSKISHKRKMSEENNSFGGGGGGGGGENNDGDGCGVTKPTAITSGMAKLAKFSFNKK